MDMGGKYFMWWRAFIWWSVGILIVGWTALFPVIETLPLRSQRCWGLMRKSLISLRLNHENSIDSFDSAVIFVKAGTGGPGSNSFRFGKGRQHIGPYGGSGGDGGSVYLCVDKSLNTLRKFRNCHSFHAENGQPGDKEYRNGAFGSDIFITLPAGTVVTDNATTEVIADLQFSNQKVQVAKGGRGGKGNAALRNKGEPAGCTAPEAGERRWLKLELKLLADVGLIGLPNAGKSTLLKAITNANPKIANYAFTTLVPNLGVSYIDEDPLKTLIIADIPGLIEGAHNGTGLGKDFLRHIEKCQILLHVIDGSSQNPIQDYLTINQELLLYSPDLAKKPQIVVNNKIDLPEVLAKLSTLEQTLREVMPHNRLLSISAAEYLDINILKNKVWQFFVKIRNDAKKS